jgi:mannose-1-phosphate guanylyltransferase
VQALILAGGEGTRLRPLTSTVPKLVVPLVDRPFISYMLEWLRRHGVDQVIMSCGFMADGVRAVLGDGSSLGLELLYVEEPEPLGTGGALKFAQELLRERFLMLNGDVLTDIDLTDQLRQHERTGARATLALVRVGDPSAYGLVRRHADASIKEFVEKPRPEQIDTNLISAGAYVLERDVLDEMAPSGRPSSIERDVFPKLVGRGLYGYEASGYWLDIGTPERYLQGTFDILERAVRTEAGDALGAPGATVSDGEIEGTVLPPALIGPDCSVADGSTVGPRAVLGRGVSIGPGTVVTSAVVLEGASIGADTTVDSAIVGPMVKIGRRCRIEGGAMLGEGVVVGDDNVLSAGVRIFPGVELPAGALAF